MRIILRATTCLALLLVIACRLQPAFALSRAEAEFQINQATSLNSMGHYAAARRLLIELTRTPYANQRLYSQLAYTYMGAFDAGPRDLAQAENLLNKCLQLDPQYSQAYRQLAQLAIRREEFDKAIAMADKALSQKNPDRSALYHRGQAYAGKKQYAKALVDIDSWLKCLSPEQLASDQMKSDELLLKATVLERLNRWDDAVVVYRQILPYRFDMMEFSIVRCLSNEKKFDAAVAEISKVIKKNPQDDEAFHLRANLRLKTHDLPNALADCNTAIDLNPLSSYYRDRAQVYEALGKPELAKKDRER